MKYLCLIYGVESVVAAMPAPELQKFMEEFRSFTEGIRKSGQWLAGERLRPVQTATTVRVRDGKVSATDGPFAETKEQLGGFYMIEARDLNDAIQIASRIPSARYGSVEVRPVWEMNM
ncbi:MAG TPA: YciI family protein [Gemmatimonadales bacterium]|nr:YciI family protein [Gemmatimonadales bacterium]